MDLYHVTWTCNHCEKERPDSCISVRTVDTSADYDLPEGTMRCNFRYCNDNPECITAAQKFKERGGKR